MPEVLIVEVDADTRNVLAEILASEGFEPVAVATSNQAIEHLSAHRPPCMVLLDIDERDDAATLLRWTREQEQFRNLRVAIMSGWRPPERRLAEFRDYIVGVLAKPFGIHDLTKVVAQYCPPAQH
jgi:CheY-like chemotaxis protein